MKYLVLAFIISFIGIPYESGIELFIVDENNNEFLLLQERDIMYYDWGHHEIYIKESSYDIVMQRMIAGKRFIVKLNNKTIYSGVLDYDYKSEIGLVEPTILCSDEKYPIIDNRHHYIKIWYFGKGYDKRNNMVLFYYLKEHQLLKSNY